MGYYGWKAPLYNLLRLEWSDEVLSRDMERLSLPELGTFHYVGRIGMLIFQPRNFVVVFGEVSSGLVRRYGVWNGPEVG